MMIYYAHSGKDDILAQPYADHITGVCDKALVHSSRVEEYKKIQGGAFSQIVYKSAVWHDLGKLDEKNQDVLSGKVSSGHLPLNHVDAGTSYLLSEGDPLSSILVYSHHRGLPDMGAEKIKGKNAFRDDHPAVRAHTDRTLSSLIEKHRNEVTIEPDKQVGDYRGDLRVYLRLLLSCLADADHEDTAVSYRQVPLDKEVPLLHAKERLEKLDEYVSSIGSKDERGYLRQQMYLSCRDAENLSSFSLCDSPVGSGKTTAVMAHCLHQAKKRGSRRIFVVLPFTNIITQAVNVYRKALVLEGEDPEDVVAGVHCRADFQDADIRYLSSLWRAPIIVTTAVAFFETMASNRPSCLRKLHELPGSVIFVDEFHNAMPLRLVPLAWQWMNVLADEWGCYWVLASGSMIRYWDLSSLKSIGMKQPDVPEIVDADLREQLMKYERNRVCFKWNEARLDRNGFISWIHSFRGPRLVIMNTVQSAAVIAEQIRIRYGRNAVEHLSTALCSQDREKALEKIRERLSDPSDEDWTLVATSCIEAGVDISFTTGFREASSLVSLLQTAGRINRNGKDKDAEMWSFCMQDDDLLKRNPSFDVSERVLIQLLKSRCMITPGLSTQSVEKEMILDDSFMQKVSSLLKAEENMGFETIAEKFNVIDNDTVLAIVDEELVDQIKKEKSDWKQLQRGSVAIKRSKVAAWKLKRIKGDLYQWTLEYSPFLGYMQGLIGNRVG